MALRNRFGKDMEIDVLLGVHRMGSTCLISILKTNCFDCGCKVVKYEIHDDLLDDMITD